MTPTAEESTSKSLLAGLRQGHPAAWSRVVDVYEPSIRIWCQQSRLPEPDVDEVVQRVILTVVESIAKYRRKHPDRSFRKWLWTVTRTKLLDTYREVYRHELFDPQSAERWLIDDGLPPDEPPREGVAVDATLARAMELVRQQHHDRTWRIFWRSVRGEGSTADIAADFGTTPANVRQIKKRLLTKLHDILEMTESNE
ncbi:MAG: sigma-70 family RNA polymerase sigma factor [Planctomycetota bacterium]